MKHCRICGTDKPTDDFHKRKASVDGLAARCKSCQSEYDRKRARLPHRVKARKDYQKTEAGKAAHAKATKKWLDANGRKRRAHVITGNAIRDGVLVKNPCEVCGGTKVNAHHDDYSKPLDVRWLCDTHHKQWHAKHGEAKNPR